MSTPTLGLTIVPGRFAVCRLDPQATIPDWVPGAGFFSITQTTDELSIVCRQDDVPEDVPGEPGWACLKVDGPLDFSLTGVLAALTRPLAEAGISVFALSTYDTDYLLVKEDALAGAVRALRQAGHTVTASAEITG